MSALKFLSKKSWHTGLIKNNEKVWLREQAEAKEKQRVAELQKQLEEERRLEEIQRLEIESGRLDPVEVKRRQRIEWMYEDGPTAHSKAAKEQEARDQEDALLGKKSAKISSTPREKDPEKARLVDVENKLREDPMLLIERERRRATDAARAKRPLHPDQNLSRAEHAKIAARLARKAERREIREIRKRRRAERDAVKKAAQRTSEARGVSAEIRKSSGPDDNQSPETGSRYGLQVPKGGTGVLVQEKFVPTKRITHEDERGYRRSHRIGRHGWGEQSFVENTTDDHASKREQMRLAAERLHHERRQRAEFRDAREAREEHEDEQERMWNSRNVVGSQMSSKFVLEAMKSQKNSNISDRIQQRRPSASQDGASY